VRPGTEKGRFLLREILAREREKSGGFFFFFFWCLVIVILKRRRRRREKMAMAAAAKRIMHVESTTTTITSSSSSSYVPASSLTSMPLEVTSTLCFFLSSHENNPILFIFWLQKKLKILRFPIKNNKTHICNSAPF